MATLTKQERTTQIQKLLEDAKKHPPDQTVAVEVISIGGTEYACPVIKFPAEDVLLNPESHRLRSQLQGDPEWATLSKDPYSARAQQVVERYVRESRKPELFQALKDSLVRDGQEQPGVMTHEGVLINANTRAVALRDVGDPKLRYIKAAVLPATARDSELALLELRLQMQKDLKEPYSLTNELLFIEEMYTQHKTPPAQIAEHLRLASGRKGETDVKQRLTLLSFIRLMQTIPAEPLRLTFFDDVKLEHLKDLHGKYEPLASKDPKKARRLLENWLLSVGVGLNSVHKLRHIDEFFDDEYMLPHLKQDEGIGDFAESLVEQGAGSSTTTASSGAKALLGGDAGTTTAPSVAGGLLNLLTRPDKRIEVTKPGAKHAIQLDQRDVVGAIKAATFEGIREKQGDDRNDNKLEAPVNAVKAATASLEKAVAALGKVHDDPEFTKGRRDKLEMALKKHRKALKNAESSFADFGVNA